LLVLLGLNKFNHCSVMCKTLLLNTAVAWYKKE
jgi:ribosomal protein L30/L7E